MTGFQGVLRDNKGGRKLVAAWNPSSMAMEWVMEESSWYG